MAITRRFLQEKALVAMVDMNIEKLDQSRDELLQMDPSAQILTVPCDITNEANVVTAVKTIADHFGKLNIAVNNAGVSVSVPSDECTLEQWNWVMGVNCTGSFLISREAIKVFKNQPDGGAIVFINSDDSLNQAGTFLRITLQKLHSCIWLALSQMNLEKIKFAPIAFLPGAVFGGSQMWTPELRAARAKIHGFDPDLLEEEYKKNNALGVIIDPAEIAELVVFLASDKSAKMTGAALVIDGGGLGGYVR
jgi:NAD(P)-dependent dehydrogenase (short-subunit alcohol dehydrogenase family)